MFVDGETNPSKSYLLVTECSSLSLHLLLLVHEGERPSKKQFNFNVTEIQLSYKFMFKLMNCFTWSLSLIFNEGKLQDTTLKIPTCRWVICTNKFTVFMT